MSLTKNTFLIRHNVTCKSSCVIYLMECCLCKKSQYIGKSEYSLNLRISTHRNDVCRTDGPPWDNHFQMPGQNFNPHAKFTIIKEVYNKSLSKLKTRSLLEQKEDFAFWNLKLFPHKVWTYHLIILKTLLDSFGSHVKTRFHTLFCSFHSFSSLITWMSYAKFIWRQI